MDTMIDLSGILTGDEIKEQLDELQRERGQLDNKIRTLEDLRRYPCVKASKHFDKLQIVLFIAPQTGINLNGNGWPMGYWSSGWAEDQFEPYHGGLDYKAGAPRG